MRVLIAVTHLLGTGHLARAMTLGAAFAARGHTVSLVSGGMPAPHLTRSGVTLHQLPPLRSDGVTFSRLLDERDHPADATYLERRTTDLLRLFHDIAPDVLITELFPFGRRMLAAEFTSLLTAAQARKTLVLASIRDILAPPSKPAKAQFAADTIAAFYSGVLVHGDPELTPLSLSWPVTPELEGLLRYTGFVAPAPAPVGSPRRGILVSAGGGAVGDGVFETALAAARQLTDIPWQFVVAGPPARVAHFAQTAPDHVRVDGLLPDFRQRLGVAAASVSLVGYNTVLDLLQTGTPAMLIPFDDGNEVEQTLRAKALADLPGFALCAAEDLTPERLVTDLTRLLAAEPRAPRLHNMDGARRSVDIVEDMWARHEAG